MWPLAISSPEPTLPLSSGMGKQRPQEITNFEKLFFSCGKKINIFLVKINSAHFLSSLKNVIQTKS